MKASMLALPWFFKRWEEEMETKSEDGTLHYLFIEKSTILWPNIE